MFFIEMRCGATECDISDENPHGSCCKSSINETPHMIWVEATNKSFIRAKKEIESQAVLEGWVKRNKNEWVCPVCNYELNK